MEIKKAKALVDEMLELCSQVEDETLTEASDGIYRNVHAAKSIESVMEYAEELLVFVNETPWKLYDAEDVKGDIESLYNQLLEGYEEFE